jgi:hypothetical protein
MAKSGSKVEATTVPARMVYCGPNIPGGALQQFTVFKGGFPLHLAELVEKCPAIKLLCVSPDQLQATRIGVTVKGSASNIAYGEVIHYIKQGGK